MFIDQHLLGGAAIPTIGDVKTENGKITAMIRVTDLREANLHYTVDTTPINQRQWKTQTAEFRDNSITANAPPAETSAWFLTVTDSRDSTISSPVFLRPTK